MVCNTCNRFVIISCSAKSCDLSLSGESVVLLLAFFVSSDAAAGNSGWFVKG